MDHSTQSREGSEEQRGERRHTAGLIKRREGSEEQRGERRHTAGLEESREELEEQRGERRHTAGLEESRERLEEQREEGRHTGGLIKRREGSEEQRGERRHKAGLEESREGLEEQRGERRHTTGLEESREGSEEQRGERRHTAELEENREGSEEQRGERRHTTGLEESREGSEEQRGERRHTAGLEESREGSEEQRGERRHKAGLEESREGLEEQRGERRHTTGLEESREGLEEQRGERRHKAGLEESREGLEEQRGERRHTTGLEESREGLEEQRGERRHTTGLEESREGLEEQRGERRHTTGLEESREGLEEQRGERRHTTGLEESREGLEEQRGERRHTTGLEESREGLEEQRGERRHTTGLEESREGLEEQRGERRHKAGLEESREGLEEQRGERRHTTGLEESREGLEEQRGERRHTTGLEESRDGSEEQRGERRHTARLEESKEGSEEERGERRHTAWLEENREGSEEQRGERRHTGGLEESREELEEQRGERRHTAGLIKRKEGSEEQRGERRHTAGLEESREGSEEQTGERRHTAGLEESRDGSEEQRGERRHTARLEESREGSEEQRGERRHTSRLEESREGYEEQTGERRHTAGLIKRSEGSSEEHQGAEEGRAIEEVQPLGPGPSRQTAGDTQRVGSRGAGSQGPAWQQEGGDGVSAHPCLSAPSSLCAAPPPPLAALLADTRLTLDVFPRGAVLLCGLWEALQGAVSRVEFLRLGSEEQEGLDRALTVIGQLSRLRSLSIRGSVLSLRRLVLHSNNLHSVPSCLLLRPDLELDLRNNPLGRPPTPASPPSSSVQSESVKLPELHLGPNQHSFSVCQEGCHVFLPGGAELVFPRDAVSMVTVQWAERRPHRKWVWLEDHDILLSRALELRPHGTAFQKPVEVCLPFSRPPHAPGREVLIRRFDGSTWTQLHTTTRRGSRGAQTDRHRARVACCTVSQFSWFLVLSCLLEDSCSVPPQGALLLSSVDPRIKVTFTPRSTLQTRMVKLQVLKVGLSELRELTGDPQASCSPLVRLSQSTLDTFLLPVRVQIPLPPEVTGHSLDRSCLYLLHGDPASRTWTDVTAQVGLQLTQLYALFSISHFSWYWLWYTTRRCVGGVVRRVYERLRMFRVQFLVLQRKSDPEQVLLQCLPSQKVESTLQSLSELYDGPRPSDLCELLEGEQFFAGFERGLEISSERPDCVGGRLSFVFYSHLKNHKEVYICPSQDQQEPVRGQVSFYRGEVPSSVPQDAAQKRKGPDSQWLATLPLRLPSKQCTEDESLLPPLNLGDPESGYLTEANLLAISLRISQDWRTIGINLGLSYQQLDRIQYRHRDDLGALVLAMLFQWARSEGAGPGAVPRLVAAMKESGREDVAAEIEDIVRLGTRKYHDSLRRVGLQAGQ
ncbi:p53-induced death domain-containing protein 1 isoform X2 [Lepisosteus oculatus]|uniref:p53-induced death domain-containing protein 1 isoform X2 n=1 Tax=Lepisosteus oculatus TaxID=7918 RepID=UPI0035F51A85